MDTKLGRFGYISINNRTNIPYIFRGDKKYGASTIVLMYLSENHYGRYGSGNFTRYDMHRDERKLFKEIDRQHNDSRYGFVGRGASLIDMDDVLEVFDALENIEKKINLGAAFKIPGKLIRIAANILPAIQRNDELYVLRHILAGADDLPVISLTEIEYMYMRFLYTAIKGDKWVRDMKFEVACVNLNDIIEENTDFDEEYWPENFPSDIKPAWPFAVKSKTQNENNNNEKTTQHKRTDRTKGKKDNQKPLFVLQPKKQTSSDDMPFKAKDPIASGKRRNEDASNGQSTLDEAQGDPDNVKKTGAVPKKKLKREKQTEEQATEPVESRNDEESMDDNSQNDHSDHSDEESHVESTHDETHEDYSVHDKSKKTGPVPKKKIKLEKQAEEDMNFYEVDSILAFKKDKRGNESVLIHWKGYDSKFDSWEPVNHVNAEAAKEVDVLRDEWQKKKKKAKH